MDENFIGTIIGLGVIFYTVYFIIVVGMYVCKIQYERKYVKLLYWIGAILHIPLIVYFIYIGTKFIIKKSVEYIQEAFCEYKEDRIIKIESKKVVKKSKGELAIFEAGELSLSKNKTKNIVGLK